MRSVNDSGVLGSVERVPATDAEPVRSADLVLAGRPLPVVGRARLYTCGITPYDVTHLGHAATFVWADLLARVLRAAGTDVVTCRNITDVDDVLTRAAAERGRAYDELAATQSFLFERDMKALSVARPTHEPHARGHVGHVVQLASALLRVGAAYEARDGVWFRAGDLPGRLGLDEEEARSALRSFGDDHDPGALESPFDVPVWRSSPPEHPAWPSPWGWGRPGWHSECAAMGWTVLGTGVDVLTGGADLAFPHHAYQVAMVEAASGVRPYARARLGVGEVAHEGRKMAKSTGNLVLVADLLRDHAPSVVRLMLLDRRWDEPWEFTADELTRAAGRLAELYAVAAQPPAPATPAPDVAEGPDDVLARLLDDLDVPGAVEVALGSGPAARTLVDLLALTDRPA